MTGWAQLVSRLNRCEAQRQSDTINEPACYLIVQDRGCAFSGTASQQVNHSGFKDEESIRVQQKWNRSAFKNCTGFNAVGNPTVDGALNEKPSRLETRLRNLPSDLSWLNRKSTCRGKDLQPHRHLKDFRQHARLVASLVAMRNQKDSVRLLV